MLYLNPSEKQRIGVRRQLEDIVKNFCERPPKTRMFITVDAEEDGWGDFRRSNYSVENIKKLPLLQAICDRYGARPTYLVNWAVLKDDQACRILKDLLGSGRCEVGTHCHPWHTPPFEEEINHINSMMCNLPPKLVEAKIGNLVALTQDRLQVQPTSFRAGRWGFGPHVAEALIEHGYRIDTSVCPAVDWRRDFGPDYSAAPDRPYRFNPMNILSPDTHGHLLEIPASMGFFQTKDNYLRILVNLLATPLLRRLHLIGVLERMGVMNFRWLSPEVSSTADMVTLSRALIAKGCPTLNLSFHSTSLLPGKSPYVRSQRELEAFLHRIQQVLEFAARNNIEFSGLSEYTC